MEGERESDYRHDAGQRKRTLFSLFLSEVVNKGLLLFRRGGYEYGQLVSPPPPYPYLEALLQPHNSSQQKSRKAGNQKNTSTVRPHTRGA
jgi:hypothetical protein